MNTPRLISLSVALAASLAVLPASAQNLLSLYQSAKGFDARYQSARAAHEASLARAEQTRALLLPSAGLSMGVNRTHIGSDVDAFEKAFGNQSATLSASHPLYRPANTATAQQGLKQVALAQAQLAAADQDLMVRVSQAYFDVLAAQDALGLVQAKKKAVAEQLAAAKRNFEVGTATITDTREAQASYDLVLAQEIAADNELRVKRLTLDLVSGQTAAAPRPLLTPVALPALSPDQLESWVQQSEEANPAVQQARLALDVARLETEKAQAGHKPTLDVVGSYNITRNNGSSSTSLDYRTNVASLGLSFNLPLFSGYATQNRIKETLALEEKSRSDLDDARRSVALATRSAFLGVQSGLGQVKALAAAETSGQSALDATLLGYEVGVRINIDVLNAQTNLFDTRARLAKARYDVLVGGLKLRQASGVLKEEDLAGINALLAP